jgi:hypothetical protein
MKAYEFPLKFNEQGVVELPPHVKSVLKAGMTVKVLVMIEETEDEERAWEQFAAREFFRGYSEADSIYDDYDTAKVVSDERSSLEKAV